ncbi:hypothetical protein TIFTF001_042646 [Ficus carica]|uniref:Uncharacterized protein n=1 Tax=Ficus carica TaxID=3494 RepID=A0AA88D079_FICCA|nr:hypothetical protein TIFTF001_042646 [Ficus carica]
MAKKIRDLIAPPSICFSGFVINFFFLAGRLRIVADSSGRRFNCDGDGNHRHCHDLCGDPIVSDLHCDLVALPFFAFLDFLILFVVILRLACKREAPRSNGDTSGVSATGTSMLKSVMVPMSKQRDRVLARKNYPYLNGWVDHLFIDVTRGPGRTDDSDGLNSECSRRVDMLQVVSTCQSGQETGTGDRIGTVADSVSGVRRRVQGAGCRARVLLSAGTRCHDVGSATLASTMGLDYGPLGVHNGEQQHGGDSGRLIRFPGEHLCSISLIWSDVHGHRLFSTNLENEPIRSHTTCSPWKCGFPSSDKFHWCRPWSRQRTRPQRRRRRHHRDGRRFHRSLSGIAVVVALSHLSSSLSIAGIVHLMVARAIAMFAVGGAMSLTEVARVDEILRFRQSWSRNGLRPRVTTAGEGEIRHHLDIGMIGFHVAVLIPASLLSLLTTDLWPTSETDKQMGEKGEER